MQTSKGFCIVIKVIKINSQIKLMHACTAWNAFLELLIRTLTFQKFFYTLQWVWNLSASLNSFSSSFGIFWNDTPLWWGKLLEFEPLQIVGNGFLIVFRLFNILLFSMKFHKIMSIMSLKKMVYTIVNAHFYMIWTINSVDHWYINTHYYFLHTRWWQFNVNRQFVGAYVYSLYAELSVREIGPSSVQLTTNYCYHYYYYCYYHYWLITGDLRYKFTI